jgi:DNA-binding XRE family transcriptional regulator
VGYPLPSTTRSSLRSSRWWTRARRSTVARVRAAPAEARSPEAEVVVREAPFVERLAYTRSQAAEALGISRSTFTRHVLPFVETVAPAKLLELALSGCEPFGCSRALPFEPLLLPGMQVGH